MKKKAVGKKKLWEKKSCGKKKAVGWSGKVGCHGNNNTIIRQLTPPKYGYHMVCL
jgi:hypothetical protein